MVARKPEPNIGQIIDALEEVNRRLNATNALLLALARGRTESLALDGPAALAPDTEGFGDASVAEIAPAGGDEAVLRHLALPHGLSAPMEKLIDLRNARYPDSRPRYWGIVNFGLHSAKPRLFLFDVMERTTRSYLCAHGSGSEGPTDDGFANVFSNTPGSAATSLGIYRCAETYTSDDNGYSLKLDGLDSTNSNARARLIVMHGAWYVSQEFANAHGRIGRSQGCPALDHAHARTVIDQLKGGSLLFHWKGH